MTYVGAACTAMIALQNAYIGMWVFPRLTSLFDTDAVYVRLTVYAVSIFFLGGTVSGLVAAENFLEGSRSGPNAFEVINYVVRISAGLAFIYLAHTRVRIRLMPTNAIELEREREDLLKNLKYLATHDALTGLCNADEFKKLVEKHMHHVMRYGYEGSIIFLDLDGFKAANDTYGHRRGDMILSEVSKLLTARVRETDTVGRVGGDEFAILLPRTYPEDAVTVAESILEALVEHDWNGSQISASLGVASWTETSNPTRVLELADAAMYEAKRAGGARVSIVQ